MSPFAFRFERVLKVKELREQGLQQELASAGRALAEAEERRRAAARRLSARTEELRRMWNGIVPVDRMLRLADYVARLKGELEKVESEVAERRRVEAEARSRLLAAVKERKTLETLRERDYQAYLESLSREEQRRLDEVARNVSLRRERTSDE